MKFIRFLVLLLIVVGALNWGLVGFFHYNLIDDIFGVGSAWARIIYALVGLAGIYGISFFFVPEIYGGKCVCKKES
jgi:uncharacterized membrane protein YuzA (DUF378 family)